MEKAFGVSMDTLMRMENSYGIALTRKRSGDIKVARFKRKPTGAEPASVCRAGRPESFAPTGS